MPKFSQRSLARLETCHPDLQEICKRAILLYDFSVLEGHRGAEAQNAAFDAGKSKLRFPRSKHNKSPSLAVDIAPYPIDWHDHKRFYYLAGIMTAIASGMSVRLRWGGDWSMDGDFDDQTFNDLPHFEIVL